MTNEHASTEGKDLYWMLMDIEYEATHFHGLTQGLEVLMSEADGDDRNPYTKMAANAAYALCREIVKKAEKLSLDIEAFESTYCKLQRANKSAHLANKEQPEHEMNRK